MLEKLQSYIQQHNLANSGTPILVAVSGGVDSMVLADVLLKLNYKIGIAHCNFGLRGNESDGDEKFVGESAASKNIPFYTTRFDVRQFKKENDASTQMAARTLRYEWFEKIRKENGFHVIAVAHHFDDQMETVLLNITKGTGIKGLTGMQPKNGFVIRPMLQISKKEILDYASENSISFRVDSSNASDDYQRNLLRLQVFPQLQKINPSLHKNMSEFIARMTDYEFLVSEQLSAIKKKCWSEKNGIVEIKQGFIRVHPAGQTILYYLLKDFGFNKDQTQNIFENINDVESSGKQFFSDTHRLVVDRKNLLVVPAKMERENYLLFEKIPNKIIFNNYKIDCAVVPVSEVNLKASTRFACFDLDKIEYPLLVRYYKTADYFYPMGLSKPKTPGKAGKKKLSKYFKDEKFSLLDKENTPVLFSGEKLIWLVGHRIDDRYKITPSTKNVLKLTIVDDQHK